MIIVKQSADLLYITHDALELIEQIGRVSHQSKSTNKKNETNEFIGKRIADHHFGLFEHAHATFRLITSRGISHELVRHRLCSFCQESTRYCNYSDLKVVLQFHPSSNEGMQFQNCIEEIEKCIEKLKNANVPLDKIRDLYPTCLKTEIVMSANFRQWMHVLKLRLSLKAHPMMQELMSKVFSILYREYPLIFNQANLALEW